jgi:hypothetical protein
MYMAGRQEVTNMPKKDGTGPVGKGPMTGLGSGRCIVPINSTKEEIKYLRTRQKALKEQLKHVEDRLKVLEVLD